MASMTKGYYSLDNTVNICPLGYYCDWKIHLMHPIPAPPGGSVNLTG